MYKNEKKQAHVQRMQNYVQLTFVNAKYASVMLQKFAIPRKCRNIKY